MKTLFDTVAEFISGDWGADIESVEAPVLAHCIRAADVEPIEAHNYTTIPTRYLSRKSFTQRQLKFGDIVIEKSGGSPTQSTGRVVYISHALLSAKTNLVCSNFCTAIRLKREWHPYFVFQYWRQVYNAKVFFNYEGKTSGLKNLQLETAMKSIPIPKIDPPTQLRIAGLLGSLDEKIELNRRKIAELEALAKTIYDYWFVQFDFPNKNGRPYKSSGGKMIWNSQLKREVPEGWDVINLPQIATYLFGFPFDSSLFNTEGNGFPIVRIRNVKDGQTKDYTKEVADTSYIISNGDFLIGMDGYFDMNHWIGGNAYLVQRTCRVKAKNAFYDGWLSLALIAPIKHLESSLSGATLAHLGKKHLDEIRFPLPPVKETSAALALINNVISRKVELGLENQKLTQQRDELLPLLMNGQVVVK